MKARKFMSALLVLALCLGLMGATAFATGSVVVVGTPSDDGSGSSGDGLIVAAPGSDQELSTQTPETSPTVTPPANDGLLVIAGAEGEPGDENTSTADETTVALLRRAGVEETKYDSLEKALADAKAGDDICLLKDVSLSPVSIPADVDLYLNGKTLSLSPTAQDQAAITLAGDAMITGGSIAMKNGGSTEAPVKFAKGFDVKTGTLSLDGVDLTYAPADSSLFAGSVVVESSSFNVKIDESLIAEGQEIVEKDGTFYVKEKVDTPPVDPSPVNGPVELSQNGSTKYFDTVSAALKAAEEEGAVEIKLTADLTEADPIEIDRDCTIDLGGNTLSARVNVNGKTVLIKNGTLDGELGCLGTLSLEKLKAGSIVLGKGGRLTVADAEVETGDITVQDSDAVLTISAGKFGAAKCADGVTPATKAVSGGSFKSIDEKLIADGYVFKDGVVEKAPVTGSVKDADGDDVTDYEYSYFKGANEAGNNVDLVFTAEPALKTLSVNGSVLTVDTDYSLSTDGKTITIKKDAAFLKNLKAGVNELSFTLDNGAVVETSLRIWPEFSLDRSRYVKESKLDLKITTTDIPDSISICSSNMAEDHGKNVLTASDFSVNGNVISISSQYLDKLANGTQYVGLWYDGQIIASPITVAPAPSVSFIEANKDGKWLNLSSNTLGFNVSPDVLTVYVDGVAIDAKNYSVSDKNVLTLKSSYLASLAYGEHSLVVSTSDGDAGLKFTTAPSVAAKNGSTHTKGGTKDLAFVSSDKVKDVYVGQTKLTSDQYTLSSDGKTITLKAAFLNTLKADTTYTLTVYGDAGQASTTFKILSPGSAASSPKTGDESGVAIWAAVMIASGIAAAALLPRKKKQ